MRALGTTMAEPADSGDTGRVLIARMRDAAPGRYVITLQRLEQAARKDPDVSGVRILFG